LEVGKVPDRADTQVLAGAKYKLAPILLKFGTLTNSDPRIPKMVPYLVSGPLNPASLEVVKVPVPQVLKRQSFSDFAPDVAST
jgi:hypothetical protein